MKRVLVVHYTQSGQLGEIAARIVAPLRAAGVDVVEEILRPREPYPFPWPFFDFLDAFPESFRLDPPPNHSPTIDPDTPFDLVILAYQVWYLSPAMPMTAFLQSAEGRRLVNGRPVVTVVACRNMWLGAQEKMTQLVAEAGGRLIDHVAFTDDAHPLATFVTTPRWVLTGRRDRFLGLPPAGVASAEIAGAERFGRALAGALARDEERSGKPLLGGLAAVRVNPRLIVSERAGQRAFRVWSGLIRRCGKRGQWRRRPVLAVFVIYLLLMIITVVPLSLLLQRAFAPLLRPRLDALRIRYEQPSGSGTERLHP